MSSPEPERIPATMRAAYEAVVVLTDAFSRKHLNDEYAVLCRRLAAQLSRKRPSPLSRGKPETWAAGIVHALGMVNFLFDATQVPHVRASEIYNAFRVSEGAAGGKSRYIREVLGIYQSDPRWSLPRHLDENPLAWLLEVNGLVYDARYLPRAVQEAAHQKGLIPYIPADRGSRGPGDTDEP
jgi:hypothetical protein